MLRVFGVRVRITDEGDGDITNTSEGVKNVYKGFESQADTATVLVCNHVTAFDVLPLLAVVSGASVLIDAEFFRAVSPVWHRAVGAVSDTERERERERERDVRKFLSPL